MYYNLTEECWAERLHVVGCY